MLPRKTSRSAPYLRTISKFLPKQVKSKPAALKVSDFRIDSFAFRSLRLWLFYEKNNHLRRVYFTHHYPGHGTVADGESRNVHGDAHQRQPAKSGSQFRISADDQVKAAQTRVADRHQ